MSKVPARAKSPIGGLNRERGGSLRVSAADAKGASKGRGDPARSREKGMTYLICLGKKGWVQNRSPFWEKRGLPVRQTMLQYRTKGKVRERLRAAKKESCRAGIKGKKKTTLINARKGCALREHVNDPLKTG